MHQCIISYHIYDIMHIIYITNTLIPRYSHDLAQDSPSSGLVAGLTTSRFAFTEASPRQRISKMAQSMVQLSDLERLKGSSGEAA